MIERLLKASNELVVAYFIMLPFRLAAEKSLVETVCGPFSGIIAADERECLRFEECWAARIGGTC